MTKKISEFSKNKMNPTQKISRKMTSSRSNSKSKRTFHASMTSTGTRRNISTPFPNKTPWKRYFYPYQAKIKGKVTLWKINGNERINRILFSLSPCTSQSPRLVLQSSWTWRLVDREIGSLRENKGCFRLLLHPDQWDSQLTYLLSDSSLQ